MATVTALVLARNEEEMIARCLKRLSWADEILVIDSFSEDRTVELAQAAGAKVVRHPFRDFSTQTNFGLSQASCDWTLQVDADEMVTPALRDSVLAVVASEPRLDVFSLRRDSYVFGRRMRSSAWSGEWVPRLFRKGSVRFSGLVHQEPNIGGREIGRLDGILLHYTYRSTAKYFEKFQLYSTLWAENAWAGGRRTNLVKASFSALWRFFHNYFIRGDILDGSTGLVVSALAGMHTFIRHVKLWGLQNADAFARLEKEDDNAP